jgi:hypothetical protein
MTEHVGGTRSMLGTQSNSRKTSAPRYGFGSSTREGQEKVFVSQEHAALTGNPVSPGPAVYNSTGAVGPQVNGVKESAPRWAFGSDQRFGKPDKDARDNPAPGTYTAEMGIGNQVDSKKTSLPRYGFGTSTRENQEKVFVNEEMGKAGNYGKSSPGPSSYTLTPAVGKQMLSYGTTASVDRTTGSYTRSMKNSSQPTWIVGKAERFREEKGWVPGPGAYGTTEARGRITPACGTQIASTKASLPRYGFGTSNREHAAKVYLSPEHDKVNGGKEAPGPGAYPIQSMTGAQIASSTKHTGASWGFGTSQRFQDAFKKGAMQAPGPGHYVV